MKTFTAIVACCLIFSPLTAWAQNNGATAAPPRLIISERAFADALAMEQPPIRERRDSVRNGAVIGAVISAVALGGFVGWLCNMLQEPGDPSCLPPSLLYTGVGAGIGAAAGAGVDALFARSTFAPSPLRRTPRLK